MTTDAGWRVVLHRDRGISFAVVVYLVRTLCATTVAEAGRLATDVRHSGSADVAALPDADEAERLVIALQRRGLHATVRRA